MSGIIGGGVAGAIVLALRAAAKKSKPGLNTNAGNRVARYPLVARALSWFLVLPALAFWLLVSYAPGAQTTTGFIFCSCFTAGVLALFLEFTYTQASWSESEVTYCSVWHKPRVIRWEDIGEVRFSAMLSWVVIRSRSGVVIRFSTLLGGLAELLETLKKQVAPALATSAAEAI